MWMMGTDTQVLIECRGRLPAENTGARSASFAHDIRDIQVKIDVGHLQPCAFGAPHAAVRQQSNQRVVSAVPKALSLAGLQQSAQLIFVEHVVGFAPVARRSAKKDSICSRASPSTHCGMFFSARYAASRPTAYRYMPTVLVLLLAASRERRQDRARMSISAFATSVFVLMPCPLSLFN